MADDETSCSCFFSCSCSCITSAPTLYRAPAPAPTPTPTSDSVPAPAPAFVHVSVSVSVPVPVSAPASAHAHVHVHAPEPFPDSANFPDSAPAHVAIISCPFMLCYNDLLLSYPEPPGYNVTQCCGNHRYLCRCSTWTNLDTDILYVLIIDFIQGTRNN